MILRSFFIFTAIKQRGSFKVVVLIGRKERTQILPKFTLGLDSPNPNSCNNKEIPGTLTNYQEALTNNKGALNRQPGGPGTPN